MDTERLKFSVGYQLADAGEEPFPDIVRDFRGHIAEVYFPWLSLPSGRSPMATRDGAVAWSGQQRLEQDLAAIKRMGIALNLLLNANCYGAQSVAPHLENLVGSIIAHLAEIAPVTTVTTASLMIAASIKRHFPDIRVRASVNMRIGTVPAMDYVKDIFDEFCVQREYNRRPERLKELKRWADEHGKSLHILANSGCLNFCSGQIFHDNLVAHEHEIGGMKPVADFNPCVCWKYYADRRHWVAFLQNSWIRPEDIEHYLKWSPVIKLATRMHANPRKVIQAYAERHFDGNLIDLLEPGHNPLFAPYVVANARFPADWYARTTACDNNCRNCDYCATVLNRVLVPITE